MTGRLTTGPCRRLHVVDQAARDAAGDQIDALLGDALEIECRRDARSVQAVVPNVDLIAGNFFTEAHEAAFFLDRERAEAHEAHELQHLGDGVLFEDDFVNAWLDRLRVLVALRLVDDFVG